LLDNILYGMFFSLDAKVDRDIVRKKINRLIWF